MKFEKAVVFTACFAILLYLLYTNHSFSLKEFNKHHMTHSKRSNVNHTPFPLPKRSSTVASICPSVQVNSRYAFVTYIGINTFIGSKVHWYIVSACKLAQSLLLFSPEIDFIMMIAIEDGLSLSKYQQDMIEWSGWQICTVNFINSNNNIDNRFYHAQLFTKLHVFRLAEYEAIACIDSDMFAIKNASVLFYEIWPEMQSKNLTLAMGLDYPRKESKRTVIHYLIGKCIPSWSEYNAGIFVLQPSLQTYNDLMIAMNNSSYQLDMCDQGLLNEFFKNKIYELPYKYNANLVTKICDTEFYNKQREDIVFMHFTVAKPWMNTVWTNEWMWTCPWWNLYEECALWSSF